MSSVCMGEVHSKPIPTQAIPTREIRAPLRSPLHGGFSRDFTRPSLASLAPVVPPAPRRPSEEPVASECEGFAFSPCHKCSKPCKKTAMHRSRCNPCHSEDSACVTQHHATPNAQIDFGMLRVPYPPGQCDGHSIGPKAADYQPCAGQRMHVQKVP